MLQEYTPTILDDMDHYNIGKECWQCAHYKTTDGFTGKCTSLEQAQAIRDLTGVLFGEDMILPVTEKTDASLCGDFMLSHDEAVRLEIRDMLNDAIIESQRHADHYAHLRRTEYAY